MNRAIWTKAVGDAKGLWLGSALVLFSFHWLFVWLTSVINLPRIPTSVAELLPAPMQGLIPIPLELLAAPGGMLALAYVDPIVLFTPSIWAIARGSDCVSGPLDRGTLEMVIAQPVRRTTVLLAHATVTTSGSLLLVVAGWLGIYVGLAVIPFDPPVDPYGFLPAAVNLFAFTFFLAGFSTALSACHRYRWQTIGWAGGFYIFELILKVLARMAPHKLDWMKYFTFFGPYEPANLVTGASGDTLMLSLEYNGVLVGLGLICYFAATVIFARRDLPAPL